MDPLFENLFVQQNIGTRPAMNLLDCLNVQVLPEEVAEGEEVSWTAFGHK